MNTLRFAVRRHQQRCLRGVSGRRYASFYNTDVAGLTEDQMEVRRQRSVRCTLVFSNPWHGSFGTQWQTSLRRRLLP